MIAISQHQMDLLRDAALEAHVGELAAHLGGYFPAHVAAAGGSEAAHATARAAIARACSLNCLDKRSTTCLVTLFAIAGTGFDADPVWAGVVRIAETAEGDRSERLAAAVLNAAETLARMGGPDNRALHRMALGLRTGLPALIMATPGNMADRLADLWPLRAEIAGAAGLAAICEAAQAAAPGLGLTPTQGANTLALARFLLGAGVTHDPLRPFAAEALAVRGTPEARSAALAAGGQVYLQAFLAARGAEAAGDV